MTTLDDLLSSAREEAAPRRPLRWSWVATTGILVIAASVAVSTYLLSR